ncbi:MAG: SDR family oxidoreductase [Bacteroidaceae bacterium]|nr:SDR family oxidoreductase [Bacteroidaceae bacterium]
MKNTTTKTALITGASSGLGMELARLHAQNGDNLVLVARSVGKMQELKEELEQAHGIKAFIIGKDLSLPTAPEEVYQEVKAMGIDIEYLINNAGFGGRGTFAERPLEQEMMMINVDIVALTKLTKLYLPEFIGRGHGRILNVSSPAGEMPGPLQAVYYASKAYVTSLSNAVWFETQGTGVTVTTLLPGAMDSGFTRASDMQDTKLFERMVSPAIVARAGFDGMMRGRMTVTGGLTFMQKIFTNMTHFIPKKMLMKQIYEMQQLKEK